MAMSRTMVITRHHNTTKTPQRGVFVVLWCWGGDLNSHGLLHWFLRPARLPITPPQHFIRDASISSSHAHFFYSTIEATYFSIGANSSVSGG